MEKNYNKNNNEKLKKYILIADFFSEVLGECAEVVIQDVTDKENSIIYIKNGHISGRKVGSPLTDFGLKILHNKSYVDNNYISNYTGKTKNGKILQSSTYFIKEEDEIIGMLCVNIDITHMFEARNMLDVFINRRTDELIKNANSDQEFPETFSNDINEVVDSIIQKTILNYEIPPDRMKPEEKISLVHELNEKGVFSLKGAVQEVAKNLETSEATIYRYLNKK